MSASARRSPGTLAGRCSNATTALGGQSPPVANERVTLASLAALMHKIQAAFVTTTDELRTELAATQEGVTAAEK